MDTPRHTSPGSDNPTWRQRLHWATGDRDAEAKTLSDLAGDGVADDDAQLAVQRAHGEIRDGAQDTIEGSEIASVADAEHAASDRNPKG